jgi:hypothetical protein
MIELSTIFDRAVNLFDDPYISSAYVKDPVSFQTVMRSCMIAGKPRWRKPASLANLFASPTSASGMSVSFDGTGAAAYEVPADDRPSAELAPKAAMSYSIGGTPDASAAYDAATGTVTFSSAVPTGTKCSFAWYYAGNYANDPSSAISVNVPSDLLTDSCIDILAYCCLLGWDTHEMNDLLQISNILTDDDFKLYSPANNIEAQNERHAVIQKALDTQVIQLQYMIRATYKGGVGFGQQ